MDPREKAQQVIKMLADYEEAVAGLYQACAEKFPKHRRFWSELADEEIYHSHLIRSLCNSREMIFINDERFDERFFDSWPRYLAEKLIRVKSEKISFKEALMIALGVESALLEGGYFDVLEEESLQFRRTMYALVVGTDAHTNKIRAKLFGRFWKIFHKKDEHWSLADSVHRL